MKATLDGRFPLVSIVAPVYNEAATLREFTERLVSVCRRLESAARFEFILVDDGSSDDSLNIARMLIAEEPRLRVIELRRNFGQTAALQAGLAAARGSVIISMDSDLQHFPEDIPLFLDAIGEGYDLVCGWRLDRDDGIARRWPSRAANLILKHVVDLPIHDFGTTFRAHRADLVHQFRLLGDQHRFVPALAALMGARVSEVRIRSIERPFGTSNYGLGRTFTVLLDIVFLYFYRYYFRRPLKAFGLIALLLLAAGGALAAAVIGYSIAAGVPIERYGAWVLLAALTLLASLQILLTGLLAELLVHMHNRTGPWDNSIIRQEWSVANLGVAADEHQRANG